MAIVSTIFEKHQVSNGFSYLAQTLLCVLDYRLEVDKWTIIDYITPNILLHHL